jgi:DNA-binding XRE family transcriptional regulator
VKARKRVKQGLWENPGQFITPAERHEYGRRGGAARAKQHRAEMEAGTWRSPAPTPGAREKLSRPRKNVDNPELHRAHEKLKQGARMTELTEEEAAAYRAYRRERRAANLEHFRHQEREVYARRMATPESRARTRVSWKESRERMKLRPPNHKLKQAREQLGLTQTALAEEVGVSTGAVSKWERFSVIPRSGEVRRQVAEVLGLWPWPGDDERGEG